MRITIKQYDETFKFEVDSGVNIYELGRLFQSIAYTLGYGMSNILEILPLDSEGSNIENRFESSSRLNSKYLASLSYEELDDLIYELTDNGLYDEVMVVIKHQRSKYGITLPKDETR